MSDQLGLLPTPPPADDTPRPSLTDASWELDEHTRTVGRIGLAAARQALQDAAARRAA